MDIQNSGQFDPWIFSLKLGRRKNDPVLTVNFKKSRAWIRYKTSFIKGGIYLEDVSPGPYGHGDGIILAQKDWSRIYFMSERLDWGEDDYFEAAELLIQSKGYEEKNTL